MPEERFSVDCGEKRVQIDSVQIVNLGSNLLTLLKNVYFSIHF